VIVVNRSAPITLVVAAALTVYPPLLIKTIVPDCPSGMLVNVKVKLAVGVQVKLVPADKSNDPSLSTTSAGVSVTGRATGTQTTDNDGSFDLSASNHFVCTPSANFTLTFTNHTAGQAGTIILINSGGYTVSAASTTKVMGADLLTTISTAGTYVLGYISDGTDTRIYNSGAQQ